MKNIIFLLIILINASYSFSEIIMVRLIPEMKYHDINFLNLELSKLPNFRNIKKINNSYDFDYNINRVYFIEFSNTYKKETIIVSLDSCKFIEYYEFDGTNTINDINYNNYSLYYSDTYYNKQWYLDSDNMNIEQAWQISKGNENITIAYLDTGLPDYYGQNDEFAGRVIAYKSFLTDESSPYDMNGHGTNVMSLGSAKGDNEVGIAGINWYSKIISVKILDKTNSGSVSAGIEGILYAVNSNAHVINMSFGKDFFSEIEKDAIDYGLSKNCIFVASMMNNNESKPYYPAALDGVIAVGGLNEKFVRAVPFCSAAGSNYGPHLDFMAPGNNIVGLSYKNINSYSVYCGTSQAAPIMSGIISLVLSVNPKLNYEEIMDILINSAVDLIGSSNEDKEGKDDYYGWGVVNVEKALKLATTTNINEQYKQFFINNGSCLIFNDNIKISDTQIQIINILGQTVFDNNFSYIENFDYSFLESGVYLILIKNMNIQTAIKIAVTH